MFFTGYLLFLYIYDTTIMFLTCTHNYIFFVKSFQYKILYDNFVKIIVFFIELISKCQKKRYWEDKHTKWYGSSNPSNEKWKIIDIFCIASIWYSKSTLHSKLNNKYPMNAKRGPLSMLFEEKENFDTWIFFSCERGYSVNKNLFLDSTKYVN